MGLVETLIIGSYVWTATIGAALWKQIEKVKGNHLAHIEERLKSLEDDRGPKP